MDDFVSVARIVKTRGIKGEVAADLLTDFPERFSSIREVRVTGPEGTFEAVVENFWFHQGRVILKFEGLDRPHQVAHMVGGLVQVPEEQRVELPEDTFFHDQLVGCRVMDAGEPIGKVVSVLETGPLEAGLMVEVVDGTEVIVPLRREFVHRVEVASRTIETRLPSGLLELNQGKGRAGKKRKRRRRGGKAG